VQTTIEIPDALFRRAKAAAAEQGKSLNDFFTEAVRQQLAATGSLRTRAMPWEKAFGGLKHLHKENLRIARLIDAEFENIDEEQWR
jgi:HicB family